VAHLLDAQPRTPHKWAPLAQRYLDRSLTALREMADAAATEQQERDAAMDQKERDAALSAARPCGCP